MPEDTLPKSPDPSTPSGSPITPQSKPAATASAVAMLSAALLAAAFFLPWTKSFFGGSVSGFQLQKLGGSHLSLWIQPVSAVAALLCILANRRMRYIERLAGIAPIVIFLFYVSKIGDDIVKLLGFGAYVAVAAGIVLLGLSHQKKP